MSAPSRSKREYRRARPEGSLASARRLLLILGAGLALSACGEPPQEATGAKIAPGAPAWQGSTDPAYTAPGWKAGDQASWDEQLRNRAQRGQNEYTRTAAAGGS